MTYPLAVSPSTLTPGVYLTVDLVAGASAAGVGDLKVLLVAPKSTGGDLTADSEIRAGAGEDSAGTAFGTGTPGHLAAQIMYAKQGNAQIDFAAPTAGAGSAVLDITPTGSPTGNNSVDIEIDGYLLEVAWLAGETVADFTARATAAINAKTKYLPVTCTDGSTKITLTFKVPGNIGNDCQARANLTLTQTGTEAIDTGTYTNLAGGTTDPDVTNILAAAAGEEYHYIVLCLSNADAEAAGTSNAAKLKTHISTYNTGLDAKLQQGIVASTGTLANAKTGTANRNVGYMQHEFCISGLGLPSELAASEAGGRLAAILLDPAANRIGEVLPDYRGADDKIADKPTAAEAEDAIGSGVSIVTYNRAGDSVDLRPVTTYSTDGSGAPDTTLLDTENVDGAYIVARDIRTALPTEFPNAKITKDTVPGAAPPPNGVLEERDVKSWVISRLRSWVTLGVVNGTDLEAAVTDGSLIVQVNDTDSTQVDFVLPIHIFQPVAKWGVVVQRQPG